MRRSPMRVLGVILVCVCAPVASSSSGVQTPSAEESFARAARRAIAHGDVSGAERMARSRPAGDGEAAAVLARLAIRRGDYEGARTLLEPPASADPAGEAALELGVLLQLVGQNAAAARLLERVYRAGGGSADPERLFRAARAAHALDRPYDANALYRAASRVARDPAVDTAWGALFLEKHEPAEALKSFKQAIEADAKWAPAHAGAGLTLADENPPTAADAARRALDIDRDLADAHLLLAQLELDNTRYAEAREHIDRVLAVNERHLDARALLGAIAYVRDDRAGFEAEVKRVLAINPSYGEVYRVAGDVTARHYRFPEAVTLTRQALALDAANAAAHFDLGMHLMRTGDEREAREVLDRAFKLDGFNRVTNNLLLVLEKLEKFEEIEEGLLILKVDPREAPVLREYALPLAKRALETLSARYDFTPEGPILIEIFPQHDDFAVRNLGLPGLVGALGACFGRVVSLDSPSARAPGSFSWQATLWHEMAHVITLQMSKQRVPRWLTEGISVYEEARAKPAWGRDMELPFAHALERGQVLKLRDLNSGFTRPDTIALSYFQASLLVDHLVSAHGEPALRTLLRSYGEGLEGEEALKQALGVTWDTLQASFDRALDARFGALRAALRAPPKAIADSTGDMLALRAAARSNPGSYQAQLAFGAALAAEGSREGFEPLERAAALVPVATGEKSPHALMGALAEKLGDRERAIREYTALLENDHTALAQARRLAELAAAAGDEKAMTLAYGRIVEIDPFDAQGHTGLGRQALKRRDAALAIREFRAALAVGPADRASAHCDLGESYLLAGKPADAKREVLAALEIAPSFERAQELLLKIVDGGPPRPGAPGSPR